MARAVLPGPLLFCPLERRVTAYEHLLRLLVEQRVLPWPVGLLSRRRVMTCGSSAAWGFLPTAYWDQHALACGFPPSQCPGEQRILLEEDELTDQNI